jgi:uncharacterized damage-inducible protein DinB
MDAQEYLIRQFRWLRRQTDAVMFDLTDELYNWTPPGTANPIGAIFVHMLGTEDEYVQRGILSKARFWESGDWETRLGTTTPLRGENWDEAKTKALALDVALEYQTVVRGATDAYLAALTAEELDRRVEFLGRERRIADVLAMLVVHNLAHVGEIAALKGVQGVQGSPI